MTNTRTMGAHRIGSTRIQIAWEDYGRELGNLALSNRAGIDTSGILRGVEVASQGPWGPKERTNSMITVTPTATSKVKEIMTSQNPVPTALRVAVVGGGCSGFSYHMAFENQVNETDNVYEFDGLKVLVDQMSE